jgi:hypothetical protein
MGNWDTTKDKRVLELKGVEGLEGCMRRQLGFINHFRLKYIASHAIYCTVL